MQKKVRVRKKVLVGHEAGHVFQRATKRTANEAVRTRSESGAVGVLLVPFRYRRKKLPEASGFDKMITEWRHFLALQSYN